MHPVIREKALFADIDLISIAQAILVLPNHIPIRDSDKDLACASLCRDNRGFQASSRRLTKK